MTETETAAGRHVLDVISAAGRDLTITDIAARLFANPLRVTPVVIELCEAGKLIRTSERVGPDMISAETSPDVGSVAIVKYGIAGPEHATQPIANPPHEATRATGRPSPYPTKGRADLRAQNGAERLTE